MNLVGNNHIDIMVILHRNMSVNIVIPMAGAGSRFAKAGYKDPKPFIDACEIMTKFAAEIKEKFGYMVGFKGNDIVPVPLEEAAGKLKGVDPKCDMIKEAKMLGISFGD